MLGIFTDEVGRVRLVHHRPEDLPPDRVPDALVEELPEAPMVDEDHQAALFVRDGVPVFEVEERVFSDDELLERAVRMSSRLAVIDLARRGQLEEGSVARLLPLFPAWVDVGREGEWYVHEGHLYECLQDTDEAPVNDLRFWRRAPWQM